MDKKLPQRTCVGCRKVDLQRDLVRVASDDHGQISVDRARGLPGRGAWIHPRPSCIQQAVRGGIARGLKRQVSGPEIARLVSELSRTDDKSGPGLASPEAVEISPLDQGQTEDQRSEDARL